MRKPTPNGSEGGPQSLQFANERRFRTIDKIDALRRRLWLRPFSSQWRQASVGQNFGEEMPAFDASVIYLHEDHPTPVVNLQRKVAIIAEFREPFAPHQRLTVVDNFEITTNRGGRFVRFVANWWQIDEFNRLSHGHTAYSAATQRLQPKHSEPGPFISFDEEDNLLEIDYLPLLMPPTQLNIDNPPELLELATQQKLRSSLENRLDAYRDIIMVQQR